MKNEYKMAYFLVFVFFLSKCIHFRQFQTLPGNVSLKEALIQM